MAHIGSRRPLRFFVQEWRKKKGLTQQQLADRINVTKATVSKLERGEMDMSGAYMAMISDALAIDPESLLHDPDRPTPNELLRGVPEQDILKALEIIRVMTGTNG